MADVLRKQIVILEIEFVPCECGDPTCEPADWHWESLCLLRDGESVTVVQATEAVEIGEAPTQKNDTFDPNKREF